MRLNFTILRTLSEQRIVIPNERLASGILRNDTLESDAVGLDVSLWLPAGADVPRALDVLREETGQSVSVAEAGVEGTRLAVGGERVPPPERAKHEAELREQCLRRLRADGLLGGLTPQSLVHARGLSGRSGEGQNRLYTRRSAAAPGGRSPMSRSQRTRLRRSHRGGGSQQGPPRPAGRGDGRSASAASRPSATSCRSRPPPRRCPR